MLTWKLQTYTYEKCKGAVLEMASCVLEIKYSVTTSYKDSINVLFPTTHAEIQTVFSAKEIFWFLSDSVTQKVAPVITKILTSKILFE